MQKILIKLIHLYRFILSPWIGQQCRFYPSCSHYAEEAILNHGAIKGSFLALRRLLRCQPFSNGGLDPVPPNNNHCCHQHQQGKTQ